MSIQAAPYDILNYLPFIDVIVISGTCKYYYSFCRGSSYLQHRLRHLLGSQSQILDPKEHLDINGYAMTLVMNELTDLDPTVLNYLFLSKTALFQGLERFIGTIPFGLRAIEQDNRVLLEYILSVCTVSYDREIIKQVVKIRESIVDSIRFTDYIPHNFNSRFLPLTSEDHVSYGRGRRGDACDACTTYLCGLVDGGHWNLLPEAYESVRRSFAEHGNEGVVEATMISYIVVHGTIDTLNMMKPKILEHVKNASDLFMYPDAVRHQSKANVRWIFENLSDYRHKFLYHKVYPPSQSMVDLLRDLNIRVSDEQIMVGALASGNWSLLMKSESKVIRAELYYQAFVRDSCPPYMIEWYIRNTQDHKCCDYLLEKFIDNSDAARIEAVLKAGFQLDRTKMYHVRHKFRNMSTSVYPMLTILLNELT